MKNLNLKFITIILLFNISLISFGQTNIDKVTNILDNQNRLVIKNWKLSPDEDKYFLNADTIFSAKFDASQWTDFKINGQDRRNYAWLQTTLTLPENIGEVPVKGQLGLELFVFDSAYVWVNNEYLGNFQWDKKLEISKSAKPGDSFKIVIKTASMHPMNKIKLHVANLYLVEAEKAIEEAEKIALGLKTAQKLTSSDTYQQSLRNTYDPKIDKTTLNTNKRKELYNDLQVLVKDFDTTPFIKGDFDTFINEINNFLPKLKPYDDYAKQFTLYFTSNAHIDAAWLWRENESIEVCKRTFSSATKLMKDRPELYFAQSQSIYYEWMEKYYPEIFEQIKKYVKSGQWELIGGTLVEPDCNLISGESWSRQLLYGQVYFKDKFGKIVNIGWNPDSFGYNGNMPMFYKNAGIHSFITQKIGWNDVNVFGHRLFWWESPDGSRILSYFPFNYNNKIDNAFSFVDQLKQFEANTGFKKQMVLFGIGDHGGGPSLRMLQKLDKLAECPVFPKIDFGTAQTYIDWLHEQDLDNIPVWNDELYLEFHRGTYTTQAETKKYNRNSEVLLTNAEKFSVIAGSKESQPIITNAWKNVLFNQFHDILPGSSITEVFRDSKERYETAKQLGEYVLNKSLGNIAGNINSSILPKGEPLVVFNPLSWERTEAVTYTLPEGDKTAYAVFDDKGKEIPSQMMSVDELTNKIIFIANTPALGYKVYGLEPKQTSGNQAETDLAVENNTIENSKLKIEIDANTGYITQITDKAAGKKILSSPGNTLQFLEDDKHLFNAWNIVLTGVEYPVRYEGLELIDNGPICVRYRAKYSFLKPGERKAFPTEHYSNSFFYQDIILYTGSDKVDFEVYADWWETDVLLKVSFPVDIKSDYATYEMPYGTVKRPTDLTILENSGKWEVPSLRWGDLSDEEYGVSLINNSKYGYDIQDNVMRLSLLRGSVWPDPIADKGKHKIEYALYPHKGTWKEAKTKQKGYEFNTPLIAVAQERKEGELPLTKSYYSVSADNVVLTSVKFAEKEENALVIQLYETEGRQINTDIELPFEPTKVVLSNILEESANELTAVKNKVQVTLKANSMITVKVYR